MKTFFIALNTFREAMRHRILYLLLMFAAGLIAVSRVLGELTVGDKPKVVADVGLAGISLSAVLIGLFLGNTLVSREVERRTVFLVLAKPVARHHFIFGKALGLALTIAAVLAFLTLELLLVMFLLTGEWHWHFGLNSVLAFCEALVIMAFSIMFSTFTTPILAALYTLAFYVIGHLTWTFRMLARQAATLSADWFWYSLYVALPNLERFNVRSELVHQVTLDPWLRVELPALYGLLYAAALLLVASVIFERKDLQ